LSAQVASIQYAIYDALTGDYFRNTGCGHWHAKPKLFMRRGDAVACMKAHPEWVGVVIVPMRVVPL
jgi:hypothetical protein